MPVAIDHRQILGVTTTGVAGSATGSGSFARRVRGKLKNLSLNFHASAPATTDVTVSYVDHNGVTHVLLQADDGNTDLPLPSIKRDTHDDAGAAISALYDDVEFQDWTTIDVAVAGSDALTDAVVVGLEMEKDDMQRFWDGPYNP